MRVYLVVEHFWYETKNVLGVYATQERAEARLAERADERAKSGDTFERALDEETGLPRYDSEPAQGSLYIEAHEVEA